MEIKPLDNDVELASTRIIDMVLKDVQFKKLHIVDNEMRRSILYKITAPHIDMSNLYLYKMIFDMCDFTGGNFRNCRAINTQFNHTNLRDVDFSDADLSSASFHGSQMQGANLTNAALPHFQIVPETGSFIAYKKVYCDKQTTKVYDEVIATLEIPSDAKRTSSLVSRKCRASHARVIAIDDYNPEYIYRSIYKPDFTYEVGKMVITDQYDDDIRRECSGGVHFFITRDEACTY